MKTPEEIFEECLQARGIDRIGLQDAEVYEAGLDAIKQALTIHNVSDMLCGSFEVDNKTSSATKCKNCGREKWEHPKPRN